VVWSSPTLADGGTPDREEEELEDIKVEEIV
jgi:hypothetical protein